MKKRGLTTKEAAQLLGVTTRTIQWYVQEGKLTPRKDDKQRNIFSQAQVLKILALKGNQTEGMSEDSLLHVTGMTEDMTEMTTEEDMTEEGEDASGEVILVPEIEKEFVSEGEQESTPPPSFIFDPLKHVLLSKEEYLNQVLLSKNEYNGLLTLVAQLQAERQRLEAENVRLLEDKRPKPPWWKRWFGA